MRVESADGLIARAADALEGTADDPSARRALDAAHAVFHDQGVRATTMEDVAQRAGLGRATIYRKFATKDALVEAVLLDDLRAYLRRLEGVMQAAGDLAEQVVEGYVETLHYVHEESLLRVVVERDGDWGMRYFTLAAGPVLAAARRYLADRLREAQRVGAAVDVDADQVAELLVRLCHSLMLTPEGVIPHGDDAATRAFARSVLVPIVVPR